MKIVLTGGTGMVGRNILEHVRASDHDILSPSRREVDLLDGDSFALYLKGHKPDAVIHAAGTVGGIQANLRSPVRFLADNTQMGFNVILGARDAGIPRLLNIGSSCMYPRDAAVPFSEDSILTGPLEPTNEGYAVAKIACARLCDYIVREDPDLNYKTIIPCNIYGRYDSFDPVKAHMLPAAIHKVASAIRSGSNRVEIWGDGSTRREFMFASDLADFVYFSLDQFEKLPQALNVGLGSDHTVLEYYQAVAKVLEYDGVFEFDCTKPVGMKQKIVDVARLHRLGWRAITSLDHGIQKTVEYYRDIRLDD